MFGLHRGDRGRDEADRVAADAPAEQTDEHDEQRTEQHHRVAVLAHVVVQRLLDHPRQRRMVRRATTTGVSTRTVSGG